MYPGEQIHPPQPTPLFGFNGLSQSHKREVCASRRSGSGRAWEHQEIRLTGDVPQQSCVNLCVNNFGKISWEASTLSRLDSIRLTSLNRQKPTNFLSVLCPNYAQLSQFVRERVFASNRFFLSLRTRSNEPSTTINWGRSSTQGCGVGDWLEDRRQGAPVVVQSKKSTICNSIRDATCRMHERQSTWESSSDAPSIMSATRHIVRVVPLVPISRMSSQRKNDCQSSVRPHQIRMCIFFTDRGHHASRHNLAHLRPRYSFDQRLRSSIIPNPGATDP